jgi:farnesyl-diphosphate farnesyltransferase
MIARQTRAGLPGLQAEIISDKAGERTLIAQLPACLDWLEALAAADRADIRAVLEKIIRGQTLDLQRFGSPVAGQIICLKSDAELEEYTYLVAGCVGEFWTRICLRHIPGYARIPAQELCQIGIRFGQGLQLVNVLRDLPEDLRNGRCYLPFEPGSAGRTAAFEQRLSAEFRRWLCRAHGFLDHGAAYVRSITPARVRAACFLPWRLGAQTLELLEQQNPLSAPQRVKVSRADVYRGLALAAIAAFSDATVRARK